MPGIDRRRLLLTATAAACAPVSVLAQTQAPIPLRINTFHNAINLALFIGEANGVFARAGLALDVEVTPNSEEQRDKLADGRCDLAYSAIDNAIAMVELAGQDVIIVTGGDTSMMELLVRPEIASLADLRGRTLAVDRANTAYALQAKKILKSAGLLPGRDYQIKELGSARAAAMMTGEDGVVAGMLNPPSSFAARDKGLKSFGRAIDLIGPYQGGGFFTMRSWAANNGPPLERFIAAYIAATRMALAPANRAQSIELIAARLKQSPALAARTYDEALVQPRFGLVPDARLDLDGLKAVLSLRAEIEGQWGGVAPAADRYVDTGYYERALKLVDAR